MAADRASIECGSRGILWKRLVVGRAVVAAWRVGDVSISMPWDIHALGEQWIEEVTDMEEVQTPQEECLEGEKFKFKAHIRGWKTEIRNERRQQLLDKNEYNLRRAY
jgi:hypothetical protein